MAADHDESAAVDKWEARWALKGTWDDPAIIDDKRVDHENPLVRAVAQRLHSNESMHMHSYIEGVICPYCALRASRVLRWAAEHSARSVR